MRRHGERALEVAERHDGLIGLDAGGDRKRDAAHLQQQFGVEYRLVDMGDVEELVAGHDQQADAETDQPQDGEVPGLPAIAGHNTVTSEKVRDLLVDPGVCGVGVTLAFGGRR